MLCSLSRLLERVGVRVTAQALRLLIDPHPSPLPKGEGAKRKLPNTQAVLPKVSQRSSARSKASSIAA